MPYPSEIQLRRNKTHSSFHISPSPGAQFFGPDVTQSLAWRRGMLDPDFKDLQLVKLGTSALTLAISAASSRVLEPMGVDCSDQTRDAFHSLVLQEISNRVIKVQLRDPLQDILDGRDLQAMIGALWMDDATHDTNTVCEYLRMDILILVTFMVQGFGLILTERASKATTSALVDQ